MTCLSRGETSKKKSIPRKDRRHVEFFFLKHKTPGEEKNEHPDHHDRVHKLP